MAQAVLQAFGGACSILTVSFSPTVPGRTLCLCWDPAQVLTSWEM